MALSGLFSYPIITEQVSFVSHNFWLISPNRYMFLNTFRVFNLGFTSITNQYDYSLLIFSGLFIYGATSVFKKNKLNVLFFIMMSFGAIIAVFIYSQIGTPIYIHRQLLIFSFFYYLLIAAGIVQITNVRIRMLVLMCMLLMSTFSLLRYYVLPLHDNQGQTAAFEVPNKSLHTNKRTELESLLDRDEDIYVADLQSAIFVRTHIVINETQHKENNLSRLVLLFVPEFLTIFESGYLQLDSAEYLLSEDQRKLVYQFKSLNKFPKHFEKPIIQPFNDEISYIFSVLPYKAITPGYEAVIDVLTSDNNSEAAMDLRQSFDKHLDWRWL